MVVCQTIWSINTSLSILKLNKVFVYKLCEPDKHPSSWSLWINNNAVFKFNIPKHKFYEKNDKFTQKVGNFLLTFK